MIRVGCGFDVHPFKRGRKLILGGVHIPRATGLDGHSDADVLTHAVIDALLGALAWGDIGERFPDTDPRFAGASSIHLLSTIAKQTRKKRVVVLSVDASIAMEKPHIAKYRYEMRDSLASAIGMPMRRVSVKATTCEKLGFVGRREGAAAFAVILLNDNRIDSFYDDDEEEDD